jgi:hypothetical protein
VRVGRRHGARVGRVRVLRVRGTVGRRRVLVRGRVLRLRMVAVLRRRRQLRLRVRHRGGRAVLGLPVHGPADPGEEKEGGRAPSAGDGGGGEGTRDVTEDQPVGCLV